MHARLKISIALFVCLVFISRALFLNSNALSNILAEQRASVALSNTQKAALHADASVQEHTSDSSVTDVFEELTDKQEDYLSNIGSLAVLCIFYSFLTRFIVFLRPDRLFDFIKCVLYPKKYLSLSILRI